MTSFLKKTALALLIFLIWHPFSFSQQWVDLTPDKYTDIDFHSVWFFNKDTGLMGANNGYLFQTFDGGKTIEFKEQIEELSIREILFFNDTTGFLVVGKCIYKSFDKGLNWVKKLQIPEKDGDYPRFGGVKRIYQIKDSLFYAVGWRHVVKSSDFGDTWKIVGYFETGDFLYDVFNTLHFHHPDSGICWGEEGYYGTTSDGGESWSFGRDMVNQYRIQTTQFFNDTLGIAGCGKETILITNDGGKNWELVSSGSATNRYMYIHFTDPLHGEALTYEDYRVTKDGGKTWTKIQIGDNFTSYRDMYKGKGFRIVAKRTGDIFVSGTDSTRWTNYFWGTPNGFNKLFFLDEDYGFVGIGNGALLKTTDGGQSWERKYISDNRNVIPGAIHFFDRDTGLVGAGELGAGDSIYYTTDGGDTWKASKSPWGPADDFIHFPSRDTGYAGTGNFGDMLVTHDGGLTWKILYGNFIKMTGISSASFPSPSHGFVAGSYGLVSQTNDYGVTWDTTFITDMYLNDIKFYDDKIGYVMTAGGALYKTLDSGNTWKLIKLDETSGANQRLIVKDTCKIEVVFYNSIYSTNDGGKNWYKQLHNNNIKYIFSYDKHVSYVSSPDKFYKLVYDDPIRVTRDFGPTLNFLNDTVIDLSYETKEPFGSDNIFTAWLSGPTGNWEEKTSPGAVLSDTSGSISCTFPSSLPPGSNYYLFIQAGCACTTSDTIGPFTISRDPDYNPLIIQITGSFDTIRVPATGDILDLPFTLNQTLDSSRVFNAWLSGAGGNWEEKTLAGTIQTHTSATIGCNFSTTLPEGTGYYLFIQDETGMVASDTLGPFTIERLPAAMVGYDAEETIQIIPNPANKHIKVVSALPMKTVTAYSLAGTEIYRKTNINSKIVGIGCANWPKGTYIMKIDAGNTIINKNIIIF